VQGVRQGLWRYTVFLRVIKAAAVHRPYFAADTLFVVGNFFRRLEMIVKPCR
jgi:hypothetical protein